MHPLELRHQARDLFVDGATMMDIARTMGLPYGTVRHWFVRTMPTDQPGARWGRCPRCRAVPGVPEQTGLYCYLLGSYLGDGHLLTTWRTPSLWISCDNRYPGLVREVDEAMLGVYARSTHRVRRNGCTTVKSYGPHWQCQLPQHGSGKKHHRPIVLETWQRELIEEHPGRFLRGLFHSDGCRSTNTVVVRDKQYAYPRYLFDNRSADIMRLCQDALDLVDVEWRMSKPTTLSVARRRSVAVLDRYVGPKC